MGITSVTPQLKPPSQQMVGRRESVFNELNPNLVFKNTDNEGNSEENEPESRFVISETPSPILKSQGRYEGRSPQFGTHMKEIDTLYR